MRESRLFKIVYYLLDKGRATAPELAKKFRVSVRTIYRDIDVLSEAGIPIYAEADSDGDIHLMNHFVLDKAVLSEDEKQEILAALQSLSVAQSIDNNDTLSKFSAIFNVNLENWLEVDVSRWGNNENANQTFQMLKSAIIHRKTVKIIYADSCGVIRERKIHPLKLMYQAKGWYVKAYCMEKEEVRLFKLTRMLECELTDEAFPYCAFTEKTEIPQKEYHTITLRFPKEMAYRVYDEFDPTQVQRQENGDFIAAAKMPEDAWLIGFLSSFGTQVDILSPAYLKDILAEQAKLIYEKNAG